MLDQTLTRRVPRQAPGLTECPLYYHLAANPPSRRGILGETRMSKIKKALGLTISVAALTAIAGAAMGQAARTDWPAANHDNTSVRYSPLTQVTPANVKNLKVEWTY